MNYNNQIDNCRNYAIFLFLAFVLAFYVFFLHTALNSKEKNNQNLPENNLKQIELYQKNQ